MPVRWSLWRSIQIGAAYVGAVAGAGFASGQEVVQFFLVFGARGIWGLAFLGLLFAVLGIAVLFLVEKHGVETYQDMIQVLFGRRIGYAVDVWITLFLLTGLCVMLAGGSAIFQEHLHLPGVVGLAVTAAGILVSLIGERQGVMWINTLLIPLLILSSAAVGLTALLNGETSITYNLRPPIAASVLVGNNWLIATILYVSYNMVIGMVILSSLGKKSVQGNILGGALGGFFLGLVAFTMGIGLLSFSNTAFQYEIPMLFVAGKLHPLFKYFYILVLWFALLTTAIANAYGLVKRITEWTKWNGKLVGILLLAAAVPFSRIGFSNMVAHAYPAFGYAGLPILAALMLRSFREVFKK